MEFDYPDLIVGALLLTYVGLAGFAAYYQVQQERNYRERVKEDEMNKEASENYVNNLENKLEEKK